MGHWVGWRVNKYKSIYPAKSAHLRISLFIFLLVKHKMLTTEIVFKSPFIARYYVVEKCLSATRPEIKLVYIDQSVTAKVKELRGDDNEWDPGHALTREL